LRLIVFGPGHPFRGGIARTTTELVRALRARGHEVRFFTPGRQYPKWLYPGTGDEDPDACPPLDGTRAILDPLGPWAWPAARRQALVEQADAWVVPYWTWAWAGWWSFLLGAVRRPPVAAVVHNPVDHGARLVHRLAARRVLGRCQGLFTHAEVLARRLTREYLGARVASHPIPPPVGIGPLDREAARRELDLPAGRRVALFLGLIRPYKGVDLLLEAVARLPSSGGWQVVVAGEPWGRLGDRLCRQLDRLGIADRVRLELRWIPESEVSALLAASDLVVLPYRSGSQSAVAPLALGAGVPVVASGVGGLPEVVQHGVNGLIVEPGSVDALVAAFEGIDDERLSELRNGAREWSGAVTWSTYAEAFERLLERVISDQYLR
jgi:glycosyltransferase involved in cell wall biosynthesis